MNPKSLWLIYLHRGSSITEYMTPTWGSRGPHGRASVLVDFRMMPTSESFHKERTFLARDPSPDEQAPCPNQGLGFRV